MQIYFVGLNFALLHFTDNCIFHQLKVCGNPLLNKSVDAIFPKAFAHSKTLCHILVILTVFQTYYYYNICCGDLWSVIFDSNTAKKDYDSLKVQTVVSVFQQQSIFKLRYVLWGFFKM